jgi:hypothetical protein
MFGCLYEQFACCLGDTDALLSDEQFVSLSDIWFTGTVNGTPSLGMFWFCGISKPCTNFIQILRITEKFMCKFCALKFDSYCIPNIEFVVYITILLGSH